MAADGASGAAGLAFAAKYGLFAKIGALLASGLVAAVFIAAFDPAEAVPDPKKRRKLILGQILAALIVCSTCGPLAVRWLGRADGWFPVEPLDLEGWIFLAMPVGLTLGGLSWGLIGAMVKLRQLIAARGASVIADRVGIKEAP